MSKEHYCYRIHTLIKSCTSTPPPPPSLYNPYQLYGLPPTHFYNKILTAPPPSIIFQKSQPPVNKVGDTMSIIYKS